MPLAPSSPAATDRRPGDSLLIPLFALLSLLSGAAVLQALLLPSWPRASELAQVPLQRALAEAGLQPQPLPSRPARRSQERALSRQLGWRLTGGAELWIVQGSVRRYQDLQTAFLTRHTPELRLQARRLDQPRSGSASGSIEGHPSVQTCLVPQRQAPAAAAVTRTQLLRASDPRRLLLARRDPAALAASLWTLVQPRDFACVLVTLRSAGDQPLPEHLWLRLLPALQAAVGGSSLPGAMTLPLSP